MRAELGRHTVAPADGPPTPVPSTGGYLPSMSEPVREHPDYRMPPTQDELPYDDGEPMESPRHRRQQALLVETLRWDHRDRPRVYIGANMVVHFTAWEEKRPAFKAPGGYEGEATTWLRWVNAEGAVLPTPAEHERAEADAQRAEADAQHARAERLAAALRAAGLDVPE